MRQLTSDELRLGYWKRGYGGRLGHFFSQGKAVCGSKATPLHRDLWLDSFREVCKKCDALVNAARDKEEWERMKIT